MSDPAIDDEWEQLARAGAVASRKKLLPIVVGCVLFVVVTMGVFLGAGAYMGNQAMAREQELADRGYLEVERSGGRFVTKEERARDAGALLFVVAVACGLGAAAAGFFGLGGRLSNEVTSGLKRMT